MWDLAIQYCSYLLWFPLEILTITAILRAGARRYPLVLLYLTVTFLISVAEIPSAIHYYRSQRALAPALWYQSLRFFCDGLSYVLILAVVFSFLYRATARLRTRRLIRTVLTGSGVVFATITFLVHSRCVVVTLAHGFLAQIIIQPPQVATGLWITPWTRDLNFGAAILDMALWLLLIGARRRDHRLLMLTGGMGIMFAGEAIGQAIRTLAIHRRSHAIIRGGHVFTLAADLAFLYVWWQSFRQEAAANSASEVYAETHP